MKAFKIKKDLYWTGVLDPELRGQRKDGTL